VDGIDLAQDEMRWPAFVDSVMNLGIRTNWGLS
jgi:hypothetical protein